MFKDFLYCFAIVALDAPWHVRKKRALRRVFYLDDVTLRF